MRQRINRREHFRRGNATGHPTCRAIPPSKPIARGAKMHDAKMSHPAGQPDLLERAAKPKPTIVIARRRGKQFVDAPDMTPEKHRRRGDAANALFRELSARAAGKDRT